MKGIYVGQFLERDIASGVDKTAVSAAKAKTGLGYTNTKVVYKSGKPIGLKIWVCSADDIEL